MDSMTNSRMGAAGASWRRVEWAARLACVALAIFVPGVAGTFPADIAKSVQVIAGAELGFPIQNFDRLGIRVAWLGDLDGDGRPEVAAGAHTDDDGAFDIGAAYVFSLDFDGTILPGSVVKYGELTDPNNAIQLATNDTFGAGFAPLADFDGDGNFELVVGSFQGEQAGQASGSGEIWVIDIDPSTRAMIRGYSIGGATPNLGPLPGNTRWGSALANLGDWDGDGAPEIAVGAHWDNDGGTQRGAVYILYLEPPTTPGTDAQGVKGFVKISDTSGGFATPLLNGALFGYAVENIGDRNADGQTDIAVGAIFQDTVGVVFLLTMSPSCALGPASCTVQAELPISEGVGGFEGGLVGDDAFGTGIAWITDPNDVIAPVLAVGASRADFGGADRGAVFLLKLDGVGNVIDSALISSGTNGLPGLPDGGQFGVAVTGGDIDGDTQPDLIIGSFAEASQQGRVRTLLLDACPVEVTDPIIYASRYDDGVRICPAQQLPIGTTTLSLWVSGGDLVSTVPADACAAETADGDEMCGLKVEIALTGGITIDNFTPASMAQPEPPLPFLTGERTNDPLFGSQVLEIAWVAPSPPPVGPQKVGELTVIYDGQTPGAVLVGAASASVDAGLRLRPMASQPIALPEPGGAVGLLVGALALALNSFATRRRRAKATVPKARVTIAGLLAVGLFWSPPVQAQNAVSGQTTFSFNIGGSETQVKGSESLGDLDGDGSFDLVIGYGQPEQAQALRIVFLDDKAAVLGSTLLPIDNVIDNDPNTNNANGLGRALENMGDLNGDGLPELAVGSDDRGTFTGLVQIAFLTSTGSASSVQAIGDGSSGFTGVLDPGDVFGSGIGVGDWNGDGFVDLAVGAWGDDDAAINAGAVWLIYLGDPSLVTGTVPVLGHTKITSGSGGFSPSLAASDFFGVDVTEPGDLDGNGTEDLIVGASGDGLGVVWVLYLGPGLGNTAEVIATQRIGPSEPGFVYGTINNGFGGRVEWFPDQTGLGGGILASSFDAGLGTIGFFRLDIPPDFPSTGLVRGGYRVGGFGPSVGASFQANFGFASSLAVLPDVNGDEIPDMITSTFVRQVGGAGSGESYVFFLQDSDNDGLDDILDNCPGGPGLPVEFSHNPDQLDSDGDGVGDLCDVCPEIPDPAQGDADGDGVGDLCEPTVLLIQPTGSPAAPAWDVLVECGARAVTRSTFAVIPPEAGANPNLQLTCPAPPAGGICATFDGVASSVSGTGLSSPAGVRDDAFYVDVVGNGTGGGLCQTLDLPAKVGELTTDPIVGTGVAAAALSEEGVASPGFGLDLAVAGGSPVPLDDIELVTGDPLPRVAIELGPAVVDGGNTRWDVLLTRANDRFHRVTFGLVAPVGTLPGDMSFSGCTTSTAEPGDVRTCGLGVGGSVNPATSWTVGPSAPIDTPAGLKPHTLYVVAEGRLGLIGLPYLNLPGQTVVLGTITLSGTPDLEPALTLEGVDLIDNRLGAGAVVPYEQVVGGVLADLDEVRLVGQFNPAADTDSDGVQDLGDNCAFIPNADQADDGGFLSSEPDAAGNACQCGDGTGDGVVQDSVDPLLDDFDAIFDLLAGRVTNPAVAADIRERCSVIGTTECNVRDLVILRQAILGATPPEARCDAALSPAP